MINSCIEIQGVPKVADTIMKFSKKNEMYIGTVFVTNC